MQKRFSYAFRHLTVWVTAASVIGFFPIPSLANHPTPDQVSGWAHFILDLRWGNTSGEFGELTSPVVYTGTVTMSGEHGIAIPMHPYAWEWQEDRLGMFGPPQPGVEPPMRKVEFVSVIHNHFDGLRLRVAGPKDATMTFAFNDFTYTATVGDLATTHEINTQDIGNNHRLAIKTLPMPNPKAEVNIFWGKIKDRHAIFNPQEGLAQPLSLRPKSGSAFTVLMEQPDIFDPEFDSLDPFFRNPEFKPFFFEEPIGFDFSGSFTVPEGTLGRANPKSFEPSDGIVTKTDSIIAWESSIESQKAGELSCPRALMNSSRNVLAPQESAQGTDQMPRFMPMPPPCQQFRFDRDGLHARINLEGLTDESPLTLRFSSPDVEWSKTISLQALFMHPIMEPIAVRGEEGGGFGVMLAINEVPDKKLMRADGYAEVFLIEDGIRRHIPNPEIFESNGLNWENIDVVPPEEFDGIPEDMFNPVPFPDGEFVQVEGDPTVFLFDDGERRPIPNIETFNDLGANFEHVRRVPPDFVNRFPQGPPVPRPGQGPPPDGIKFRATNDSRVFVMDNGKRLPVPSQEIFEQRNFDWNKVAQLPPNHPFMRTQEGAPLPPPDGAIFQRPNDPSVYVFDEEANEARPIEDIEDFNDAGFKWNDVRQLPQEDFGRLDIGGEFTAGVQDFNQVMPFDNFFEVREGQNQFSPPTNFEQGQLQFPTECVSSDLGSEALQNFTPPQGCNVSAASAPMQ